MNPRARPAPRGYAIQMFRATQDVLELRRWAEVHGACPCRDPASGRLVLSLSGEPCGEEVGWDEFEPTFVTCQLVFVYDDAPGSLRNFLGPPDEAHAFIRGGRDGASAAP